MYNKKYPIVFMQNSGIFFHNLWLMQPLDIRINTNKLMLQCYLNYEGI